MLHIHNGDSAADRAKRSVLPGEHFAWRESLITGPTPRGLLADEWRRVRSGHLSEAYGAELHECEQSLLRQEEMLASAPEHEEVVLWFEHDLFCQLHLIYLLNWFSQRSIGQTKLSSICIGEFHGKENFRGLGELTSGELASLFPARQGVPPAKLELAASAWQAYCSANPTDIEKFLQRETSALPFLKAALRAHLQRFPATKNGLGRIENRALQLIHEGRNSFSDLFPKFGELEPVYGLGDAQFWLALQRMSVAREPLLTIKGVGNEEMGQQVLTPEIIRNARLELTVLGELVRSGEADFARLNDIDLWLGGVHLQAQDNLWRWDEDSQALVSTSG
jgi:hypothetical protein